MKIKNIIGAVAVVAVGAAAVVLSTPALANGRGSGEVTATACTITYADIDLASRNMNWGINCPDGGNISVDASVYYQDIDDTRYLPQAGNRYVEPGETWTVWTQDNSRENYWGAADVGVLHISQTMCNGPGCQLPLVHLVENDL